MRITLIGAGNVATHLGKALQQAGHEMVQVWSRTQHSAHVLAGMLHCDEAFSDEAVLAPSDCFIISVKDDVLESVARSFITQHPQALWLHTAGSMPLTVLADKGAQHIGVLYPMQTFSKQKAVDFKQIPLFIESPTSIDVLQHLADSVSSKVYILDSEGRKHLHLAAVFACNFVNHCYALSAKVLDEVGVPFDVMLPLIDEAADKVHHLTPLDAQTGPAIRGDMLVMNRHADLLKDERMRKIYRLLSESIAKTK
ncbi:MAG: DUF2520 domain-containing protein [Bacteroidales bacterium]|nr:DUF2520 domain-containing protein [Bacteroidales bacterium]